MQNPMDLDYRALSNTGLWCIGRLQTDADRTRVVDRLSGADGATEGEDGAAADLGHILPQLTPRWFVVRDAHAASPPLLLQPRHAMSLLRGPMTHLEIQRAREMRAEMEKG